MVDEDGQVVVAVAQCVSDIECPDGAADKFFRICVTVERDSGIGADALEFEEVSMAVALG